MFCYLGVELTVMDLLWGSRHRKGAQGLYRNALHCCQVSNRQHTEAAVSRHRVTTVYSVLLCEWWNDDDVPQTE